MLQLKGWLKLTSWWCLIHLPFMYILIHMASHIPRKKSTWRGKLCSIWLCRRLNSIKTKDGSRQSTVSPIWHPQRSKDIQASQGRKPRKSSICLLNPIVSKRHLPMWTGDPWWIQWETSKGVVLAMPSRPSHPPRADTLLSTMERKCNSLSSRSSIVKVNATGVMAAGSSMPLPTWETTVAPCLNRVIPIWESKGLAKTIHYQWWLG